MEEMWISVSNTAPILVWPCGAMMTPPHPPAGIQPTCLSACLPALSLCLLVAWFICVPTHVSTCFLVHLSLSTHLLTWPSTCLMTCFSASYQSTCLSFCYLLAYLDTYTSTCLPVCKPASPIQSPWYITNMLAYFFKLIFWGVVWTSKVVVGGR